MLGMRARHNTIRISGILVATILIASLFAFSAQQAYAPPPPAIAQFFLCGKMGWENPPTVRIITTNEPGLKDFENGDKQSDDKTLASVLIKDAISEYWNEGADVDGEDDDAADSDFIGFGTVTLATSGTGDITIVFVNTFTFRANCVVDESTGFIESATIFMADDSFETTMNTSSFGGDDTIKNTAAHELGHAIGLKHTGKPGTMMNSSFFGSIPRFSDADNPFHTAYMPLGKATQKQITRIYD